jgi:hypothetical protein
MHEIGIDGDLGNEVPQSGHLCQHTRVSQTFQSLLESEIEWNILNEDFKVSIVNSQDFNERLQFGTQLLCKLCSTDSFCPHFIGNTIADFITEVRALDGLTLMLDLVF